MDAALTPELADHPFGRTELEAALEAAQVGIWSWSLATGVVRWSPELFELYGLGPEDFDGSFERFASLIHPEDRERIVGEIGRALEQKRAQFFVQHRFIRPDGELRWTECHGRCLLDDQGEATGMTGVSVDTTSRHLAEARLRDSEESLRLFSELASDYVYRVDLRQSLAIPSIVAGSFERITGYTPAEVRELGGWRAVVHPDDLAYAYDMLATLRSGKPTVGEYRIIDRSGQQRWLRDRVRPVRDADDRETVALVGGVQDITERKLLESQLIQAQKMEALARLSGGVAHDFNNLLTVIFSATDMLKASQGDRETHLLDIEQAAERAAELTRSLLAFGQRRVGKPKSISVHEFLESTQSMLSRAVGDRVELSLELDATSSCVRADPGNLQLVLLNLVVNARDAMPDGGLLRIEVRNTDLGMHAGKLPTHIATGPWVAISVRDRGQGISSEDLPHIFEPFFTTKDSGEGTGLGLATAHGIVSQLGGTITVETETGTGTCFTVYLPATDPVDAPKSVSAPRHSIGGTEHLLLVEDEPSVRRVSAKALRELGYSVVEAGSTEDALSLGPERLREFALLVSDVRLPGRSGVDLAGELRSLRPATKVVLMSGYLGNEVQEEVFASERYAFLSKPFTPDGLARRVREALDDSGT